MLADDIAVLCLFISCVIVIEAIDLGTNDRRFYQKIEGESIIWFI